jgi:hypothetical protein
MSKIHSEEIKRWADNPDGTKVWWYDGATWNRGTSPQWFSNMTYIVDDDEAIQRMMEAEGTLPDALGELRQWGWSNDYIDGFEAGYERALVLVNLKKNLDTP